jgi:hypothetical protein
MADILISALPEKISADNTDYLAIDDGTTTYKISVENYNETGAASAAQSAAAAAQSATDALAAKNAAIQAKDDSQALITSAQTIVSNASDYANSASTSANYANDSANTATAKAAIATDAASQAAAYASNVDNFAKAAKSWAVGGTGTRSGEDTDNSKYYANEAHNSKMNAATSESAAALSETNAATSETNAAASESAAAISALNAATSETNAYNSETNAAISETNASNSASSASSSETNAANSASSAEGYSEDSEAWAWGKRNGVDVPPTDPAYHNNAKYWADAASGAAGGGVTSFNTRSGAVVPETGDYAANQISFSDSEFVATDVKAAIKEVQDNVDDVATDLTTLDNSLKPVAKSGAYNDLTGKPTLGTAAAKNYTSAVSPSSTDLVESGAVYDIADGLNNAILGNATAIAKAYKKDDTTDTTIANDDYVPFYDTSTQTMKKITTANFVGKRLPAQTLAAGSTTLTFTDSSITTNSTIKEFYSIRGVAARDVVVTNGQVDMTFKPLQTALSVYLVII